MVTLGKTMVIAAITCEACVPSASHPTEGRFSVTVDTPTSLVSNDFSSGDSSFSSISTFLPESERNLLVIAEFSRKNDLFSEQ